METNLELHHVHVTSTLLQARMPFGDPSFRRIGSRRLRSQPATPGLFRNGLVSLVTDDC
jgi:hypothetical protein